MSVLAVDPGAPGGAVLLDDHGRLVLAVAWKKNRRGWKVSAYRGGEVEVEQLPAGAASLGGYLAEIIEVPPRLLACEDVFVHRQRPNVRTTVNLARFGGAVLAPLELLSDTRAAFVQASVWRRSVLGLSPYTKRALCKAASLRFIPPLIPGMGAALQGLGQLDHLCDAGGIALWARSQSASSAA